MFTGTIASKWDEDFEARYPDGYGDISRFKEMHDWVVSTKQSDATGYALAEPYVDIDENTHTNDTAAYRLAKFKTEFEDHFNMHYSLIYYVYTFFALMTDQRAKNMFLTYWGNTGKWYPYFYDNDTSFGINNEGGLVFDYYHEDTDQLDGANVYNGQLSTLWINFRQAFADEIQETYQNLRSNSILNYDELINQFIVQGSDKWSESIYNEDQDFKYVSMLRSDNDATNLPQVRGTGEEHFRYFVENRLNYCDSKWYAGDYPEDNAIVRIYTPVDAEGVPKTDLVIPANADITVTPYSAMYAGVRYKANGTLYQERLEENETYTFEAPNEIFNDTETAIYGASQLSSLGDLAPLYLGYIDVGAATKLVELKIGDGTPGYLNSNLYHLAVGTNRLLKKIDIQNCAGPKFSQALVLSGCPNIEEVYAKGSSITGVDLPESGYLKILQLPATIANLTLKNQPYLNDLTIEGLTNLKTITIENTPVDTLSILSGATNVERVRLTNVDWHHEDASILYELINRDIGGIDENGVNTDTMWIDGKCHIEELTGNEYLEIKTLYPYLDITYTTLESQLIYMSEDGQTELTRKTIYNGGNDTCPVESGAIERPTKESTAQYDYEFNGWSLTPGGQVDSNALNKVEADRRVYAAFKKSIRYYTVGFYDNNVLLSSVQTAYGKNAVPCKKNLFNINSFNINKVINNGNGSLTLTGYIPTSNILDKVCCNLKIGETYIWSGTNLIQIHFGGKLIVSNEPFVFTQEMFDSNIIGFYAKGTTSENDPYTISNIQLELGNTVTTYEPYTTIVPTAKAGVDNPEDFEFIGWKPEPTNIQGDTTCYAQWYDTREITDDWATIEAACLDGTATEKYAIGSYKPVEITHEDGTVETINMEVIGHNHDELTDGVNKWEKVTETTRIGLKSTALLVYDNKLHMIGGSYSRSSHYTWDGTIFTKLDDFPFTNAEGSFSATVYNGAIHAVYKINDVYGHYKYDGSSWSEVVDVSEMFPNNMPSIYLFVCNNTLYAFECAISNPAKIHKYSGSSWSEVGSLDRSIWGHSMVSHNGYIYLNKNSTLTKWNEDGLITLSSAPWASTPKLFIYEDSLCAYDENTLYKLKNDEWVSYDAPSSFATWVNSGIIEYNNELHAVTYRDSVYGSIWKWSRAGWEYGESISNVDIKRRTPVIMNGTNYICTPTGLYTISGSTITEVHTSSVDIFGGNDYALFFVYNNQLYGMSYLNTDPTYGNIYKYNGNSWDIETGWDLICPVIATDGMSFLEHNGLLHILTEDKTHNAYSQSYFTFDGTSVSYVNGLPRGVQGYGCMVVYNSSLYYLVGNSMYTLDGSTWSLKETFDFKVSGYRGCALEYNGRLFSCISNKECRIYDGVKWTTISIPQTQYLGANGSMRLFIERGRLRIVGDYRGNNIIFRNPRATLTFFAKEAMGEPVQTGTHTNGYLGTNLKIYVDNVFENLNDDVKNVIKPVHKYIALKPSDRTITSIEESCWLMSANEVGFMGGDRYPDGEGVPYGVFTDKASRIRSNVYWWTRSMNFLANNPSYYWTTVTPIGALGNGSKDDKNVCIVFGFCI